VSFGQPCWNTGILIHGLTCDHAVNHEYCRYALETRPDLIGAEKIKLTLKIKSGNRSPPGN
jgi:hypothetical protein